MVHTNANYATKALKHKYSKSNKQKWCMVFFKFALVSQCFFTRWLSFKLQLGESSISLQVGCEPLVPLGLQNTKPCIQDVLVYYHKIWTCVGTAITFVLLTKEVYNTPMWRTGTGRLLAINRAKPLHFWDIPMQVRVLPPNSGSQLLKLKAISAITSKYYLSFFCNVCICMAFKS